MTDNEKVLIKDLTTKYGHLTLLDWYKDMFNQYKIITMKTIPFDIEKAKRGWPIVTKEGERVKFLFGGESITGYVFLIEFPDRQIEIYYDKSYVDLLLEDIDEYTPTIFYEGDKVLVANYDEDEYKAAEFICERKQGEFPLYIVKGEDNHISCWRKCKGITQVIREKPLTLSWLDILSTKIEALTQQLNNHINESKEQ